MNSLIHTFCIATLEERYYVTVNSYLIPNECSPQQDHHTDVGTKFKKHVTSSFILHLYSAIGTLNCEYSIYNHI